MTIVLVVKKILHGDRHMWYKISQSIELFIDDLRSPDYIGKPEMPVARTSQEAIDYIQTHGCPTFISFDHDLGDEDTSMNFVKWLVEQDLDSDGQTIPENFNFFVHSANPVGKANIESYLNNYLRVRKNVV